MPLSPREQRFVAAGGLVAVLGLGYLLWPSGDSTGSDVELVSADQRQQNGAVAVPPPAAPVQPAPVQAAAGPPAGAVPEGVRLTGLMGRGATFIFPDGSQRYIPVGAELAPGLTLQAVRVDAAMLAAGTNSWRMGFGGGAVAVGAAPGAAAAPAGPVERPANAAEAQWQTDTRLYESAMQPVTTNGRVTGFTVRPGASLPVLQRVGIQPGDTIVSVGGSEFTAEALQGLAANLSNSSRLEFEVVRGGQRMRFAYQRP